MSESNFKLAKRQVVSEIKNKISAAQSLAFAEYRGLTVSQLAELRKMAKEHGVEIKVYKNRLFKIAANELHLGDLSDHLVGPNIFAFSNQDPMSAAKVLVKFAKENKLMVIKAGTYEGKVIDAKGVSEVASLPSYEESLAILGRSLLAPLQMLSLSLKLVSEGKTE
ncbi:50S ribosomal protein L10 [Mycoplasmopsis ciconiae]|uniref:Large ribosomal subunit protein uL10 n=1 Tax=Mycoplasmopsis ciconiae TaxID=561067 RepID=A0ABU7MKG4_9BACT|nr:50S ribosomal protein L10 [Mycoplasmopsis ciconiae]